MTNKIQGPRQSSSQKTATKSRKKKKKKKESTEALVDKFHLKHQNQISLLRNRLLVHAQQYLLEGDGALVDALNGRNEITQFPQGLDIAELQNSP